MTPGPLAAAFLETVCRSGGARGNGILASGDDTGPDTADPATPTLILQASYADPGGQTCATPVGKTHDARESNPPPRTKKGRLLVSADLG